MRRLALALGLAAACDTIPAPPPLTNAPLNTCTDSCGQLDGGAIVQCTYGACVLPGTPDFTLVVEVPVSALSQKDFGSPGTLFALSPQTISSQRKMAVGKCSGLPPSIDVPFEACTQVPLPARSGARGVYDVADNTPGNPRTRALWPATLQSGAPDTSLPVVATLHPRWVDQSGNVGLPETTGIPLVDVMATSVQFVPRTPGAPQGPLGKGPVLFEALAQQTPSTDQSVQYRLELQPAPPYDGAFPPIFVNLSLTGVFPSIDALRGSVVSVPLNDASLDQQPVAASDIVALLDAPSLAGFRTYLVEWPRGYRISNLITLVDSPRQLVTFHTATDPSSFQSGALVLDPPPGSVAVPSIIVPFAAGVVGQFPQVPKLWPPATVQGTVTRTDPATGQVLPVDAEIAFDAGSNPLTAVLAFGEQGTQDVYGLTYRTFARTTNGGSYQVQLPPGTYDVWITPSDPMLARTHRPLKVGTNLPVQLGSSFSVNPRAHLTGRAFTVDGRPLAGATIVASPSPSRFSPKSLDRDIATAALGWPRESFAATDDQGNYDIAVDPGLIDLTLRPADGSRFAWSTSLDTVVSETDVKLPDIALPPPAVVRWQLTDELGNGIPNAIVSAYMTPFPLAGGQPARLVGRALTQRLDATASPPVPPGFFELFLPPCANPDSSGVCKKP